MTNTPTARQDLFTRAFLPVLQQRFSYHFRTLSADARAEATQDCIASAWVRFQAAKDRVWDGVSKDRIGTVTPSRLGDLVAQSYRSGREFLGSSVVDAMAPGTRKAGRTSLRSIDKGRVVALNGEPETGALLSSESNGPVTRFRITSDWGTIASRCKPKAQRVLKLLAKGWRPMEIASQHLHTAPARITQIKYEIAQVASDLGYGPRRWQAA
jgi:hypothetical protein